ncbi:transposase [Streptomyces sp. NPDC007901]|uniref:transposase n=1 Tax=Streptomyces sp. NPDC007901 TaxID=3364785 RepID=UPI0036E712E5
MALLVTAASVQDSVAGQALIEEVAAEHPTVRKTWGDGGYRQHLVEHAAILGTDMHIVCRALVLVIVKRSNDMRDFVVPPKRWIVERFFAHRMRPRRLARDFERRTAGTEAVIYWSATLLMTRRLALSRPQPAGTAPAAARSAERDQAFRLWPLRLHLHRYRLQDEQGDLFLAGEGPSAETVPVRAHLRDCAGSPPTALARQSLTPHGRLRRGLRGRPR